MGRQEETRKEGGVGAAAEETAPALTIHVLGVHEDGVRCAIALEIGLRGYGRTFDAALDEFRGEI